LWWWEGWETLRKVSMTSLVIVVAQYSPDNDIVVGTVICGIFLMTHAAVRPYQSFQQNMVQLSFLTLQMFTLFAVFLLSVSKEVERYDTELLATVVVLANVTVICVSLLFKALRFAFRRTLIRWFRFFHLDVESKLRAQWALQHWPLTQKLRKRLWPTLFGRAEFGALRQPGSAGSSFNFASTSMYVRDIGRCDTHASMVSLDRDGDSDAASTVASFNDQTDLFENLTLPHVVSVDNLRQAPTLEPEQAAAVQDDAAAAWNIMGVLDALAPIDRDDRDSESDSVEAALAELEESLSRSRESPSRSRSVTRSPIDVWASALEEAASNPVVGESVDFQRIADEALDELLRQQGEDSDIGSQGSSAVNDLLAPPSLEDTPVAQEQSALSMSPSKGPPMLGDLGKEFKFSMSTVVNEILSDQSMTPEGAADDVLLSDGLALPTHIDPEMQFDLTKFLEEYSGDDQGDPQFAAYIDELFEQSLRP